MPLYSWKCKSCGRDYDLPRRELVDGDKCNCGGELRRNYATVQLNGRPAFQPHFNHAVGQWVESKSQFESELKRGAEKAGSNEYVPIYPGDIPRPTKDDHVFDDTARKLHDSGQVKSKTKTIPLGDVFSKGK